MENLISVEVEGGNMGGMPAHNFKRMMNSGRQAHSRSVSESKKKFIGRNKNGNAKVVIKHYRQVLKLIT